ncbi:MAG: hypothetical protein R3B47_09425 [Bacteroidia bacterium]
MKKYIPLILTTLVLFLFSCNASRPTLKKVKVQSLPIYATSFVAIDEKGIKEKHLFEVTIKTDSILAQIQNRLDSLKPLDNQSRSVDIRMRWRLKFSNYSCKTFYIMRGGVIKIDDRFYEDDYQLLKLFALLVPEEIRMSYMPHDF